MPRASSTPNKGLANTIPWRRKIKLSDVWPKRAKVPELAWQVGQHPIQPKVSHAYECQNLRTTNVRALHFESCKGADKLWLDGGLGSGLR